MGSRSVDVDPEAGTVTAVRSIRESGNSIVLTVPKEVLQGAKLEVGERVLITADMNDGGFCVEEYDPDAD